MTSSDLPPECAWAQDAMFEARNAGLDEASKRRLDRHLRGCADCRLDHVWDGRLAEALQAERPTLSSVNGRVKSGIRTRRIVNAIFSTLTAAILVLPAAVWFASPPRVDNRRNEAAVPANQPDLRETLLLESLAAASSPPPVEPLTVFTRQPDALLAALDEIEKELRK